MRKVKVTQTKYEAEDGKRFDTRVECAEYERAMGLELPETEKLHRKIQKMKALHGPYLAKTFREYRDARSIAMNWLDLFMDKSERSPETADKLSRAMARLSWAWTVYNKDLEELKSLKAGYREAKRREGRP